MRQFLFIILLVVMGLVVLSFIGGTIAMTKGGDFNKKYGNKLMRARVFLQGLAIAIFALLLISGEE